MRASPQTKTAETLFTFLWQNGRTKQPIDANKVSYVNIVCALLPLE